MRPRPGEARAECRASAGTKGRSLRSAPTKVAVGATVAGPIVATARRAQQRVEHPEDLGQPRPVSPCLSTRDAEARSGPQADREKTDAPFHRRPSRPARKPSAHATSSLQLPWRAPRRADDRRSARYAHLRCASSASTRASGRSTSASATSGSTDGGAVTWRSSALARTSPRRHRSPASRSCRPSPTRRSPLEAPRTTHPRSTSSSPTRAAAAG